MRILHLIDQFDYCDGCARHVYLLAKYQKECGHHVSVVAGNANAFDLLSKLSIESFIFSEIGHRSRSMVRYIVGILRLRHFIRMVEPDIVHAHHYYCANQVLHTFLRNRPPLIQTIHANVWQDGKLQQYVGDKIIAVSASTKETILKRYSTLGERTTVILNGSDFIEADNFLVDQAVFQTLRTKKKDHYVVMFIGRLVEEKGPLVLVNALGKIEKRSNLLTVLVGSGPLQNTITMMASELHLEMLEFGEVKDIKPILELADVLVLPSLKWEGLPMILLEAGLLSKTVIASCTDGIPEIIVDGATGYVVPIDDADALTAKIEHARTNVKESSEVGRRLKEKVMQNHSAQRMAEQVEHIYRMAVGQ